MLPDHKTRHLFMKKGRLILLALPALVLVGCTAPAPRYSHVTVSPGESVVVTPAPVSNRSVVRVYPEGPVRTTALPAAVTTQEHVIADTIRSMFNTDPAWANLTDRVDIRVSGSAVELRGLVPNESVRERIGRKIAGIPGVTVVDNGLQTMTYR